MCKWAGICFNTHPGCDDSQECSWGSRNKQNLGLELLQSCRKSVLGQDYHSEYEQIPLHVEKGKAKLHRPHLASEFHKRQESETAYITLDDILNLRISLESTKSVGEFLSIL